MDLRDKISLLFDEQDPETSNNLPNMTKPQTSANDIETCCIYYGSLRDAVEKNQFLAVFFNRFHHRHNQTKKLSFFEIIQQNCRLRPQS